MWLSMGRHHYIDNVAGELAGVLVLYELHEGLLERRLADLAENFFSCAASDHAAFADDDQLSTDFFDDLEDMRTVKDKPPFAAENLNKIFDDHGGGNVEAGKRLVQNQDFGIVHERGDQEDSLTHPFGIGGHLDMLITGKRKKFQKLSSFCRKAGVGHAAKIADHFKVFPTGEMQVKIRLFGYIAQVFAIGHKILLDVPAIEMDFSMSWLEQADEHFYGGAFAGAVGSQVTQDTSGTDLEADVLDSGNRAVDLCELKRLEHESPHGHTRN